MKSKLIFIIGGTRSGKSRYAEGLAQDTRAETLFVATARPGDDEMRARIAAHQAARPADFRTLEAESGLASALATAVKPGGTVLIDCLTLLVSNLIGADDTGFETRVEDEIGDLIDYISGQTGTFIIVSSEVGLGIVPENALTRRYRDALGMANQRVAANADEVYFMVAGQPLRVK
jgi:adenosylcobinamide kinase / adenosylcobinamide-phosphate guanylyltransferase